MSHGTLGGVRQEPEIELSIANASEPPDFKRAEHAELYLSGTSTAKAALERGLWLLCTILARVLRTDCEDLRPFLRVCLNTHATVLDAGRRDVATTIYNLQLGIDNNTVLPNSIDNCTRYPFTTHALGSQPTCFAGMGSQPTGIAGEGEFTPPKTVHTP